MMYILGVRYNLNFYLLIDELQSFWDSIYPYLIGMLPIIIFYVLFTILFKKARKDRDQTSAFFLFLDNKIFLALLIFLVPLFLFINSWNINSIRGYLDNLIIHEEVLAIRKFILQRKKLEKVEFSSQNEKVLYPYPEFPLTKVLLSFDGPKQIELKKEINEKPNIFLIFLESFRAQDIGIMKGSGIEDSFSPFFDKLAREGAFFENFLANGVQTSRAVVATLFGLPPLFSTRSIQDRYKGGKLWGIPQILRSNGYDTLLFHNGHLDFENQKEFFKRNGYRIVEGFKEIKKKYPQALGTSWGLNDEYLFSYAAETIKKLSQNKRPLFVTLFTISNHHPWKIPGVNKEFKKINTENEHYQNFIRTFQYTDMCLKNFILALNELNVADKSIFFILADTAQPMGEHFNNFMPTKYLFFENVHIPFLIYSKEYIVPKRIKAHASQIDIVPTLMDLLNLKGPFHSVGSSLVRKTKRPRMVLINNPFGVGYLATMKDGKFLSYEWATGRKAVDGKYVKAYSDEDYHKIFNSTLYLRRLYFANRIFPKMTKIKD